MIKTPSIKLVSLNIERSKHLDLVLPFLEREQPDVVCLQELCAVDIPKFNEVLGSTCVTVPLSKHNGEGGCLFSIGIFSRLPIVDSETMYYFDPNVGVPTFVDGDTTTIDRALLRCDVV